MQSKQIFNYDTHICIRHVCASLKFTQPFRFTFLLNFVFQYNMKVYIHLILFVDKHNASALAQAIQVDLAQQTLFSRTLQVS